jgi:hypothetical protein
MAIIMVTTTTTTIIIIIIIIINYSYGISYRSRHCSVLNVSAFIVVPKSGLSILKPFCSVDLYSCF